MLNNNPKNACVVHFDQVDLVDFLTSKGIALYECVFGYIVYKDDIFISWLNDDVEFNQSFYLQLLGQ